MPPPPPLSHTHTRARTRARARTHTHLHTPIRPLSHPRCTRPGVIRVERPRTARGRNTPRRNTPRPPRTARGPRSLSPGASHRRGPASPAAVPPFLTAATATSAPIPTTATTAACSPLAGREAECRRRAPALGGSLSGRMPPAATAPAHGYCPGLDCLSLSLSLPLCLRLLPRPRLP